MKGSRRIAQFYTDALDLDTLYIGYMYSHMMLGSFYREDIFHFYHQARRCIPLAAAADLLIDIFELVKHTRLNLIFQFSIRKAKFEWAKNGANFCIESDGCDDVDAEAETAAAAARGR